MKFIGILFITMLAFNPSLMAQGSKAGNETGMVRIPGGDFQPFLKAGSRPEKIKIKSFLMDQHAVTNEEFLEFVKANPKWAKSKVSAIFADGNYLSQWKSDFNIGNKAILNSPVTNVSWFAAKAYAKWKGKRLPTLHEWEYAAKAKPVNLPKSQTLNAIFIKWITQPTPKFLPPVQSTYKNAFGLYDMNGLIWEWVYNFNSVITGGDSRTGGTLNNNLFCASASLSAVDKKDYEAFMRFGFRESLKANYTINSLGFRCAKDIR